MMQRKVPNKVLIHADNDEFDKHLAHLQQSSSQHQDGITSGDDMNKSRSIQLSDLEPFQLSPSRQIFSKYRKPLPSQVPITAKSPQKQQQPLMRTERSPHYMKPTSSSGTKKELFPANLSNSHSDHDYKDQQKKFSNNRKASVVPGKQPAKNLTRPSSLNFLSTSTQSRSFKFSRASPDTESGRTSVRKVCPYTFCSLNGRQRTPLPPLKSFLSERRNLFKAQKTMKQEELSLQRLKVPSKTKVSDIEQIVIDGNSPCDDAEVDFFIEIYSNVKKHEAKPTATCHGHESRKSESSEELQDQEVIKFMIEDTSLAAREDNIKQITTDMSDESPEIESNSKKYFKKYYDETLTKADAKVSLHREQNEESADENHLPSCSHTDTSMEICCRGIRFSDWEQLRSSEMDGCDFEATDTKWKEKQVCTSKAEERVVLAVLKEETEFKLESLSESLFEASVKSDKILNTTRLEEIKYLVERAPLEAKYQECACFEAQPHKVILDLKASMGTTETRSLIEEVFQNLKNAEDNGGKNETSLDNDVSCVTSVLEVGQKHKHIFVKDGTPMSLSDQIYNASEEGCTPNQDERATDKGSKIQKMKNTEISQDFAKNVERNGYARQGHEISELHKIEETNEGKDSSPATGDGSISQMAKILLKDVHGANIFTTQDKEMLEATGSGANKIQGTSCTGTEEKKSSKNWRGEMKDKMPINDDDQLRKFNQRKPNFLPLIPNPEREKVILKHQKMNERKSAEQWMLDHALRQAVTKLAPVRKSKVALLVEAFETVMPVTQKEKP